MAYFRWSDKLSLGNQFIDADHRRIIDLINTLHDAMSERKGDVIIGKTLFDLIVYCKGHFMREEAFMRQLGHPDYEDHKREHDALLEKVNLLHQDFKDGDSERSTLTVQTAHFLYHWLTSHIQQSDMKIVASVPGAEKVN